MEKQVAFLSVSFLFLLALASPLSAMKPSANARPTADDNPSAADQQISPIENAVHRLADFPKLGPARSDVGTNVRAILQNRYLILYRLQPSTNNVELLRVIDGRRDLSAIFASGEP
jgi:toxin ParE1/3/4